MDINNKHSDTFLYAVQGIGAVFVGIFLAAYLAGLPSTAVYHSEPFVRFLLTVFGITFLVLILIAVVLAANNKRKANAIG